MRQHIPVPDRSQIEEEPTVFDPLKGEKPPKVSMICSLCGAKTNLTKGECPVKGM